MRYTNLPCGLKIRLDVKTGCLDTIGDLGVAPESGHRLVRYRHGSPEDISKERIHLNIVTSTNNLLALSKFFLERAIENENAGDRGAHE